MEHTEINEKSLYLQSPRILLVGLKNIFLAILASWRFHH